MAVDPDKKRPGGDNKPVRVAPSPRAEGATTPPNRAWKPCVVSAEPSLRDLPGVLHTADVRALHAVACGRANADQQKRAILAVHKICQTHDISYRPDDHGGERDTVFAEGKRFVGLQMQKFIQHQSKFVSDETEQA